MNGKKPANVTTPTQVEDAVRWYASQPRPTIRIQFATPAAEVERKRRR